MTLPMKCQKNKTKQKRMYKFWLNENVF